VWLVPSTSCPSARASECSKPACPPDSNTSDTPRAWWVTVSGTPSLRPVSWRGWKTRAWSRLLFGAATSKTWTPNLCGGTLTSSRPASPASRGAPPVSSREPTTPAGSGRQSRESSETRNLVWSSSKTSPALFPAVDFISYSTTLPKSGSMRSGVIFRQPKLALRTSENGSSSWPTPDANAFGSGMTPETQDARLADLKERLAGQNGNGAGRLLAVEVQRWPTPRAEDSESCGNHPAATDSLTGAIGLWATPNTARRGTEPPEEKEARKAESGGGCTDLLTQAEYWSTGAAAPSTDTTGQLPAFCDQPIASVTEAVTWPTPNSRDHKGSDLDSRNGGASLSHFAESGERTHSESSPPAPATHDGSASSPPAPGSRRRLNPAFVSLLMGWPWWWTRAEPMPFAAEGMASWRRKLRSRLSSLCGEPSAMVEANYSRTPAGVCA
jgi:hypothetical protein